MLECILSMNSMLVPNLVEALFLCGSQQVLCNNRFKTMQGMILERQVGDKRKNQKRKKKKT